MNQLTSATVQATADVNYEGAPTFHRPLRERVLQSLMVGRFGNTFYASKRELDTEALEVLTAARDTDSEFLAKAAVYARSHGFLKDAPTTGLALLAGGRGKTRAAFENAFASTILIPDDLRQFCELLNSGQVAGKRGLGGYAAKAVAGWLANISEYHALKYGSSASKGMTLRDIIRMTHPRPVSDAASERLGWLIRGKAALGSNARLNPQIHAFEALKRAMTEDEAVTLVREGRLPFEVVTPALKATTPRVWTELLKVAPYMNLLRSLVAFTRHGVFAEAASVELAISKLTNPEAVRRSKVLPFRFFDAWKTYSGHKDSDSRIANALREALNLSFSNMPSFGNRAVAIGSDVSGSMGSTFGNGVTRYIDICGIFTGALLRRIEGRAIPLPFQERILHNHGLSGRDDVMVTAEKVARLGGGGTALGAPIQHLLDGNIRVDAFVGITDNEDWAFGRDQAVRGSFLALWREYRSKVNPEAKAFVVRIDPYDHAVAPAEEPGVHFIYGWSDAVVKYIPYMLEGGKSQIREVARMDLRSAVSKAEHTGDAQGDGE